MCICTYSSWSDEVLVDYVIDSIQKVMEEECDQYFKEISTVAVKVSHSSQSLHIRCGDTIAII